MPHVSWTEHRDLTGSCISGVLTDLVGGNGTIRYGSMNTFAVSPVEGIVRVPIPMDCIISSFYIEASAIQTGSNGFEFTVLKNGAPTDLKTSITGTITASNDSTNSVVFNAGDRFSIKMASIGNTFSTGFIKWSAVLTPQ